MQEPGLTEIIPLICTSATWGQYPVFSCPELPQGSPQGVAAGSGHHLMAARWQVFFFFSWVSSGWLTLEGCNHWGLWHPCLLIWQEISHFPAGNRGKGDKAIPFHQSTSIFDFLSFARVFKDSYNHSDCMPLYDLSTFHSPVIFHYCR